MHFRRHQKPDDIIDVARMGLSMKLSLFLNTLLVLLLAGAAWTAQALPQQDQQALQTALHDFVGHVQKADTDAVIKASISPTLANVLAGKMGMSAEDVNRFSRQQTAAILRQAQMESFHYDMGNAREGVSSSGRPYVLMPYHHLKNKRKKPCGQ